jgi:DNA ligase-1
VTFQGGKALSYTGKLIPNQYVQFVAATLGESINGLDGEITVGANFQTSAEIMRINAEGSFVNFTFHMFDDWSNPELPYSKRFAQGAERIRVIYDEQPVLSQHFGVCRNEFIQSIEELVALYPEVKTHEGCILRSASAPYQFGTRQTDIFKIKPYAQSEGIIIGFVTEKYGENLKTVPQELWGQEKDRISALVCKGIGDFPDVEFKVGTGFSHDLKAQIWLNREQFLGKVITYKYIESGSKDRPRHPVFIGFRDSVDFNIGESDA